MIYLVHIGHDIIQFFTPDDAIECWKVNASMTLSLKVWLEVINELEESARRGESNTV